MSLSEEWKLKAEEQLAVWAKHYPISKDGVNTDYNMVDWDKMIPFACISKDDENKEFVADIKNTPVSEIYNGDGRGIAYLIGTKIAAFHYGHDRIKNAPELMGVLAEIKDYKISYLKPTNHKLKAEIKLLNCLELANAPTILITATSSLTLDAPGYKEIFRELSEWEEGYLRTGDKNFLTKKHTQVAENLNHSRLRNVFCLA